MNPQKAKQVKIYGIASLVLYALCIVCCCASSPHTRSHTRMRRFSQPTPNQSNTRAKFKTKHWLAVLA